MLRLSPPALLFSTGLVACLFIEACGNSDSNPETDDNSSATGDEESSRGGEDGEGTSNAPDAFCSSDKDCEDTVCAQDRLVCVDCVSDADCGEGAKCVADACEEQISCQSSKDCPLDKICDKEAELCVQCLADADCGDTGEICVAQSCEEPCESDKDCSDGDGVCDDSISICVECLTQSDCSDSEYCRGETQTCAPRICDDGESFCDGDELQECNLSGDGYTSSSCAFGCKDGACEDAPEDCDEGSLGCACYGNSTCDSPYDCEGGICVDASSGSGGSSSGGTGSGGNDSSSGGTSSGGTSSGGTGSGGSGGEQCASLSTVADLVSGLSCEDDATLDSFDGQKADVGGCGPLDSLIWGQTAGTSRAYVGTTRHGASNVMRFTANAASNAYAGGWLNMYIDVSSFTGVEFSARALTTNHDIHVGMQSDNSDGFSGHVSPAISLTTSYQRFRVPFCSFTKVSANPDAEPKPDLATVKDLQWLVYNGSGDFYVDDIELY